MKLSVKQQEVMEQIEKAETKPEIRDKYNKNNIIGQKDYINNDGRIVSFSTSRMWSYPTAIKEVHMYKGHTSTLNALEKRGLIKIISIGEYHDIVTINKECKHIEVPQELKQYEIEVNKKYKKYLYSTSLEGLKKYLKEYYKNCDVEIIETNQEYKIEYN